MADWTKIEPYLAGLTPERIREIRGEPPLTGLAAQYHRLLYGKRRPT